MEGPLSAKVLYLLWTLAAVFSAFSEAAGDNVLLPSDGRQCACSDTIISFNCTITGSGATRWNGSAFDCPGRNNEITLVHDNRFDTPGGRSGNCNGDRIVAQSLSRNNDHYTSELSVTAYAGLNNETINCVYVNPILTELVIGRSVLTILSAENDDPPVVVLRDIKRGALVFTWSSVYQYCPLATHNISTSGCGTCRMEGNNLATCTNLKLSVNPTQCSFQVQNVACGFSGALSNSTVVNLKVPDTTDIREFLPVYNESQSLIKMVIVTNRMTSFYITDDIPGHVTQYNFFFPSGNKEPLVGDPVCEGSDNNDCEYEVIVPSSICTSLMDVSVTVSASNQLGEGPRSQPFLLGCMNQFVKVEYNSVDSIITCQFLNTESSNSNYTCSIKYGLCNQELNGVATGSATIEFPNQVVLRIDTVGSNCYVYALEASNSTFTVRVEGRFNIQSESGTNIAGIVAGVVIVVLLLLIGVIIFIVVMLLVFLRQSRKQQFTPNTSLPNDSESKELEKGYKKSILEGTNPTAKEAASASIESHSNNSEDGESPPECFVMLNQTEREDLSDGLAKLSMY